MTLIELIIFIAMIATGTFLARAIYPIGGLWLAVPGFIAGVALIPSMFFAHDRYRRWIYRGDKWMPECSCGNSVFKYEKIGDEYHLLCRRCKTRYEKHRGEVWVLRTA